MKGIRRWPVDSPYKCLWRRDLCVVVLRLNKRFSKQSRRRLFGTPLHSIWRHFLCLGFAFLVPLITCLTNNQILQFIQLEYIRVFNIFEAQEIPAPLSVSIGAKTIYSAYRCFMPYTYRTKYVSNVDGKPAALLSDKAMALYAMIVVFILSVVRWIVCLCEFYHSIPSYS